LETIFHSLETFFHSLETFFHSLEKLLEVRWVTISSSLNKVGRSLKVGIGKLNAQCAVASKKQRLG
jgi:hypothetical protein